MSIRDPSQFVLLVIISTASVIRNKSQKSIGAKDLEVKQWPNMRPREEKKKPSGGYVSENADTVN